MKLDRRYWRELFDIIVLVAVFCCFISCGVERQVGDRSIATAKYYRVEEFPSGQQTLTDIATNNIIELFYQTSTDSVWEATKSVALRLYDLSVIEENGVQRRTRQSPAIDSSMKQIEIGNIDKAVSANAIATQTWKDKIVIKLAQDSGKTKVIVIRSVVIPVSRVLHPPHAMEMMSNGNYERWILTQIDDDLAGKINK